MKKTVIYLMLAALCCSCNKEQDQYHPRLVGSSPIGDRVGIVLVDEAFNDRLNPESPAYFGDDAIEFLYLFDGKQSTFLKQYRFIHRILVPPLKLEEGFDYGEYAPLRYYHIDATAPGYVTEEGREVAYTYIRYPDGSEDEIKVQLFQNESGSILVVIDKLWVNGELAYYKGTWGRMVDDPKTGVKGDRYYNPKYYPWLLPLFDDDGNQVGIMPKYGQTLIVLTK